MLKEEASFDSSQSISFGFITTDKKKTNPNTKKPNTMISSYKPLSLNNFHTYPLCLLTNPETEAVNELQLT